MMSKSEEFHALTIQKYARVYLCRALQGNVTHNVTCPICIDNAPIGMKLSCNHEFHVGCIFKWLHTDESCPICRRYTKNLITLKIRNIYAKLVEIFRIPIETLLRFENAPTLSFFPHDSRIFEEMTKNVKLVYKNADCVQDHNSFILYKKFTLFTELKKEVYIFNQRAKGVDTYSSNPHIEAVRKRLSLPVEFLVHVPNTYHDAERDVLIFDMLSRQLHSRLCSLTQIQKKMEVYNQLSLQPFATPSMSLIPFTMRNIQRRNQGILTMSSHAFPIEHTSDSDASTRSRQD